MKIEKNQQSTNQSLIKGLSLLQILSDFPNGCPLAKIAELSELNKSTAHRMLQTLQSCGFVQPSNSNGSYRLTTKCLSIGQKTLSSLNILSISAPHLEQLNLETGETINFSMQEGHHAIMLNKLEPLAGIMRTRSYIGQQLQLYCSAMGKIFLAYAAEEYVDRYWHDQSSLFMQLTPNTITTLPDMKQELEKIRKQGFAVDNEENEFGITCFACPIFDIHNKVRYALSLSLSTAKLKQKDKKELITSVKNTARLISAELGHNC
ncbi:IclR family transcriptional regulator [Pasteurellaceae bacterium LIM206]|nr:IclR family transcriptional regulator [Pasteurellaceae bacterium LIM206]